MKKRFAAAALLCAAMFSLSACGGSGNSDTAAAGTATTSKEASSGAGSALSSGGKVVRIAAVDPQVALDPQQYTLQYCDEDNGQYYRVPDSDSIRWKSGAYASDCTS